MALDWSRRGDVVRLFLGGDVMTGRTIDRLFATHNSDDFGKPDHVPSARYLAWSAALHGASKPPVPHDYIWGEALRVLDAAGADFRLANLETSITTSDAWQDKEFVFRMHPANVGCLKAARLDCVSLANNHSLDFGAAGLVETLRVLRDAGIGHCGAGKDEAAASLPHIHELPGGKRILVFAWAVGDCGVAGHDWRAGSDAPGIQQIDALDAASAERVAETIAAHRKGGDLVIASLHWGANWVESVPMAHRLFARRLIDRCGVDLVHGHSAHHVLPAEQYKGKPILYGCGDLINDTEGRPDFLPLKGHLGALYFADLDRLTHRLARLIVMPIERRGFRLEIPSRQDRDWVLAQIRHA